MYICRCLYNSGDLSILDPGSLFELLYKPPRIDTPLSCLTYYQ